MKTYKEFHKELMRDPGYRKAYDKVHPEFEIYIAILEERIKYNLTQKQLAKKIGISQSALARFESGTGNPTLGFLQKITQALDLKIQVVSADTDAGKTVKRSFLKSLHNARNEKGKSYSLKEMKERLV